MKRVGILGGLVALAGGVYYFGGFGGTTRSDEDYMRIFAEAQKYATREFGDKKDPLTKREIREWYNLMGVESGKVPTKEQLEAYVLPKRDANTSQ